MHTITCTYTVFKVSQSLSRKFIVHFASCFTHDVIVGILDSSDGQHGYQRDEGGVEGNGGHTRDELQAA